MGACTASPSLVDTGACEKGVREHDSCKGGVCRGRGAAGQRLGSIVVLLLPLSVVLAIIIIIIISN